MTVLLDTCAVIWAVSDPEVLPPGTRDVLTAPDTQILVSPISCAELACAVERGRVRLDRHWRLWFRHYVDQNDWLVDEIGLDVVEEAYSLPEPFHRDPADRIIVATARRRDCPVVTADAKIREYPHVRTLWDA